MSARSTPVIFQQLLAAKNAQTVLAGLNSTSQVAIYNLWLWITAQGENLFEQYCDQFTALVESLIAGAPVYSAGWIQSMILQFQYSASTPQYRTLLTTPPYSIGYPTVNPSLLAISQAAVISNVSINRSLSILVAENSAPISGAVMAALAEDMNTWMIPGTEYTINSYNADEIYIQAEIFYNAAFTGVINANVIAAINAYITGINFASIFTLSGLYQAILAVPGVNEILFQNISWRQATQAPPPTIASGQALITSETWILNQYTLFAGYAISETTSGYALTDSLTFTTS